MKPTQAFSLFSFLLVSLATTIAFSAKLTPTIYFIKTIDLNEDCSHKKTIYGLDGKAIFNVCKETYNSCVLEGTCAYIPDDQKTNALSDEADQTPTQLDFEIINYVKSDKKGLPLFQEINEQKCPYGLGVQSICLDPFYTIAADLSFHKPGDVIFIEKVKGLELPNGEIHSGFFIVRDRGGAIKGKDRFDFFTGLIDYQDTRNPFTPAGLASSQNRFEYRVANKEEAIAFKKERNYPRVPEVK